ncbi:hypothetical protein B0T22DRAFT_446202 [Podospora appendiculata]|uniref:Uncharacterized protein n=1 Tax=Podospora appendiculata TaxID=314037 RepID=A0AAE0XF34_9PEZI|nr:hypothetical protein B0T22DRAFT_446202 [Podospora appendiculata]
MMESSENTQKAHIADAFTVAPDQTPSTIGPRPLPPLPTTSIPLPLSSFTAYRKPVAPRQWEPRCNHSTMTRLYHAQFECEICKQVGPFGWLYRCTKDRDALILDAKYKGHRVFFDLLGQTFQNKMTLGKYGPDARAEKFSFLKEITPAQLSSYTPHQLATILEQREKVAKAISEERSSSENPVFQYARQKYPHDAKPWMPDEKYECQYKICPRCHRLGKDKSWLSLNGILEDEIMPTDAAGFSFAFLPHRPIGDAEILRNIGYRPVPMRRLDQPNSETERVDEHPGSSTSGGRSSDTARSLVDGGTRWAVSPASRFTRGRLMKNRAYLATKLPGPPIRATFVLPKFPFASIGDSANPISSISDPSPIGPRLQTHSGFWAAAARPANQASSLLVPITDSGTPSSTPVSTHETYTKACSTPLPQADIDEDVFFTAYRPDMEDTGDAESYFSADSLELVDAVALTEEAVEMGTPDMVAHVDPLVSELDMPKGPT